MFGKMVVSKVDRVWTEGIFYWPDQAGCTENDQHLILDLFIVWKNTSFEAVKDGKIWRNVINNIDAVMEKWLALDTNPMAQENVNSFSNLFLVAVLHRIWDSGFQIDILRHFYPVLTKAACHYESLTRVGYKKLVFSKLVVVPTTTKIDGITRKRPERYYAITALYVDRQTAKIAEIKEFLQLKDQIQNKERYDMFFVFIKKICVV